MYIILTSLLIQYQLTTCSWRRYLNTADSPTGGNTASLLPLVQEEEEDTAGGGAWSLKEKAVAMLVPEKLPSLVKVRTEGLSPLPAEESLGS